MSKTHDDSHARHASIRERAYYLWQSEGCPEGRSSEFWDRARELIAVEEGKGDGLAPDPVDPVPNTGGEKVALHVKMARTSDRLAEIEAQPLAAATTAARKTPVKPRAKRTPTASP